MSGTDATKVETILRDELAREDRAVEGVPPVLFHLLSGSGHSMVSDAIVARVRGMINNLARQLLSRDGRMNAPTAESIDALASGLAENSDLLAHYHAIAIEMQLTQRLEQRFGLDPVLSRLWQELISSNDARTSSIAIKALAAQSRFVQSQRRMEHPLAELPTNLSNAALRIHADQSPPTTAMPTGTADLIASKENARGETRARLLAQLVATMDAEPLAALDLSHAGLALFASALAHRTGQSRERAITSCHEGQSARLALGLRASGLRAAAIERQLQLLEPVARPPEDLNQLSAKDAGALLRYPADASVGH